MQPPRSARLVLLIPLFLSPACVVAAGAVGGYVIHREFMAEQGHVAHLTYDVDEVWATAREVLAEWSAEPPTIQDFPRQARATVEAHEVIVTVEAFDVDRTILKVYAERSKLARREMSKRILDDIIAELQG